MCTLSFLPTKTGYAAVMNRDELSSRAPALPPQKLSANGMDAIYPREPTGGTWIACNSRGNLLALLNWNILGTAQIAAKPKSRGEVIPLLIDAPDCSSAERRFDSLPLAGTFPFRLVGVFPEEEAITEWRWDGTRIQTQQLSWSRSHWFSSSISDRAAEMVRGKICQAAPPPQSGEEVDWLQTLHRAHGLRPGAFSICMHRPDAATVSYTEVQCSAGLTRMRYQQGSPCLAGCALNPAWQVIGFANNSPTALIS